MNSDADIHGIPKCRGFTLVEVMVALVIISVSMVTLLATHVQSTRSYAEAKAMAVSSMLAQQKLTEIQTGEFPEEGEQSGTFESNGNYQWVVSIKETDLEELREVTVAVSLSPPEGMETESGLGAVTVVTYIAELSTKEEEEEGGEE
ncbi:MAG: type II secretion system minor pseudopilin GspI [Candidatus Aureabacteria bacterium]|nr:type II secretion system minor pseudopilin GspI [Candidatus Auribacterota bacterium]